MGRNDTLFDLADWLTDPPTGGPVQMWTIGAGLSTIIGAYGLSCCIAQRATTLNVTMRGFRPLSHGFLLEVHGAHAVTLGIVILLIGLFVHFQWFWGNHARLKQYYEVPKYIVACGVVVATLVHAFTLIART